MFWRWLELRGQLEAPAPQIGSWLGGLGIRPSTHCARCGADAVTWREDPLVPLRDVASAAANGSFHGSAPEDAEDTRELAARCRRCLSPWLLELVHFMGRPPRAPWSSDVSELVQLGRVLEQLTQEERRLWLQLHLLERVGDFEAVGAEANRRWPHMHPPIRGAAGARAREWSRHTVRLVVLDGRRRVLDGMVAEGLWRFA